MTPEGARIAGRVHRPDATSVPEASVFFAEAPVAVPDIAALTDEEGRFSLHAPAPGTYQIECHAEGLSPARVSVEVDEWSDDIDLDIELG